MTKVQANAPEAKYAVVQLVEKGQGTTRVAAIRNLGFLGRKVDLPMLFNLYQSGDEVLAQAAESALLSYPAELLKDRCLADLSSSDSAIQIKAIELSDSLGAASYRTAKSVAFIVEFHGAVALGHLPDFHVFIL